MEMVTMTMSVEARDEVLNLCRARRVFLEGQFGKGNRFELLDEAIKALEDSKPVDEWKVLGEVVAGIEKDFTKVDWDKEADEAAEKILDKIDAEQKIKSEKTLVEALVHKPESPQKNIYPMNFLLDVEFEKQITIFRQLYRGSNDGHRYILCYYKEGKKGRRRGTFFDEGKAIEAAKEEVRRRSEPTATLPEGGKEPSEPAKAPQIGNVEVNPGHPVPKVEVVKKEIPAPKPSQKLGHQINALWRQLASKVKQGEDCPKDSLQREILLKQAEELHVKIKALEAGREKVKA